MEEIQKWFENRGFTRIECDWATALFVDDNGTSIEIIVVHNAKGKNFYRLFCAGQDNGGMLMKYFHAFVSSEEEMDKYLAECANIPETCDGFKHPEDQCQRCGGRNGSWHAPNELWNKIITNPETLIICPRCFQDLADKAGIATHCIVDRL
jgi:hypothetical protein